MLAPDYAVMAVARVIQGISSSMVWIVGLALLYVVTFNLGATFLHVLQL